MGLDMHDDVIVLPVVDTLSERYLVRQRRGYRSRNPTVLSFFNVLRSVIPTCSPRDNFRGCGEAFSGKHRRSVLSLWAMEVCHVRFPQTEAVVMIEEAFLIFLQEHSCCSMIDLQRTVKLRRGTNKRVVQYSVKRGRSVGRSHTCRSPRQISGDLTMIIPRSLFYSNCSEAEVQPSAMQVRTNEACTPGG